MFKALSHCAKKFRRSARPRLTRAAEAAQTSRNNTACELLEHRVLFNSVTLSNGVLSIVGSATVGSSLTANLVNSGKSIDASADDSHAMTVALSSVKSISITGGSGADYIFVDTNIKLPVTISGGNGNDQVRGGGGANTIIEGSGSDWINVNGTGGNIKVGDGNDVVLGSAGNDTIVAGNGNDSLDGSDGNDSITAGNGNDTITADAGNDTVVAGNGTDSVNGGLGNDKMTVGTGKSVVIPGSGTNYIVLGNTSSTVVPSAGVNTVVNTTGKVITTSGNTSSGSTTSGSNSSGSNTSTGTISSTGSTGWVTYSASKPSSSTAPQAVMQLLAPNPVAGIAIDVNALSSVLGTGTLIDSYESWNFGDTKGEYNTLPGFNATHVYTTAGTYTVTLTVENSAHATSSVSVKVTVAADNRRAIYVDAAHGNDKNNGSSPSEAVQTAAEADALMTDNSEVFFDRGETFNLATPFLIHHRNVLVGAYGSGNQPIINYTTPGTGSVIFSTNSVQSVADTVQDLTFTTLNGTEKTLTDMPMAVMVGGTDIAVLRNTFDYVEYDVNASGAPSGLTVEDNSSPLSAGLQGYFLWDQGTNTSVIGNYADGSVHEHIIRTSSASDILVMSNNFTNEDGKGCIEIHMGAYAWVDSNKVNGGDIRVGPLGLWGEAVTSATNNCVIANNTVLNTFIAVDPGAHDIAIHNNVIDRNSAMMINVNGTDSEGRVASDIQIYNNTGISTGAAGNFLQVQTYTDGITLENNLLIMPNLIVGSNNSGPVYVIPDSLSSFSYINGNVWQLPKTFLATADDGINLVGGEASPGVTGSISSASWNALSMVGTDYFVTTSFSTSTYAPSSSSFAATADVPVTGVFFDYDDKSRPTSGKWSAGAIQV